MFVVTADQRGSRTSDDLVPAALAAVRNSASAGVSLAPERTAGDELQVAVPDAPSLLSIILQLTRLETWSVGVGIGSIDTPVPASVRAARGSAFLHARDAVERAKKAPTRLAISGDEAATDAEALVRLAVELRDRRTAEGWEIHDLLAEGITQREAASRLGITEGAVSLRVKAAGLRTEQAAVPALERVLQRADATSG